VFEQELEGHNGGVLCCELQERLWHRDLFEAVFFLAVGEAYAAIDEPSDLFQSVSEASYPGEMHAQTHARLTYHIIVLQDSIVVDESASSFAKVLCARSIRIVAVSGEQFQQLD